MSTQSGHFTTTQLLDLIDGRLTVEAAANAREHIAECSHCANEYAQVARIVARMQSDNSQDAPRPVIDNIISMFRAARRPSVRRLLATLGFDTAQLQPALGMRSGQPLGRHVLLNAEDHAVDLRIVAAGRDWRVTGQVLGPLVSGQIALHSATTFVETAIDQRGRFTLPSVPAGSYMLDLRLGSVEIEYSALELG
ncbi:MAG: hypothetical protein M3R24_38200 [Chloroflexota bacterium]|nr:hypothetical protein [Chloroflexota bacterium]